MNTQMKTMVVSVPLRTSVDELRALAYAHMSSLATKNGGDRKPYCIQVEVDNEGLERAMNDALTTLASDGFSVVSITPINESICLGASVVTDSCSRYTGGTSNTINYTGKFIIVAKS